MEENTKTSWITTINRWFWVFGVCSSFWFSVKAIPLIKSELGFKSEEVKEDENLTPNYGAIKKALKE